MNEQQQTEDKKKLKQIEKSAQRRNELKKKRKCVPQIQYKRPKARMAS
jgi:hypothetical protein